MTLRAQTETPPTASSRATGGEVVYGIVRSGTTALGFPRGIEDGVVRVLDAGEAAALVSRVAETELRATRDDLLAHSRVLEHAVKSGPVLPLRFGIVLADEQAVLSELLEPRHDELAALLVRFERSVELRVKGFYLEDENLREIVSNDAELTHLRQAALAAPEGARYAQQVRLGEAVARAVDAQRRVDVERIVARLEPLADDAVLEHDAGGALAVAASFLVARERIPDFDVAMEELARTYAPRIRFKYLGPLPPHSFVSFSEVA